MQHRGGWAIDCDALWAQAGAGPDDMDLVQTYDDYPVISMLQFEGPRLLRTRRRPRDTCAARTLTVAGDLPHNTGGGQLSGVVKQGAAGGYLGLGRGHAPTAGCGHQGGRWSSARPALWSPASA